MINSNQNEIYKLLEESGGSKVAEKFRGVTVFDLETTGLEPSSGDRITEIGAIKLSGNRICGVFKTLINPEKPISQFITELTGITNEMVENAPKIKDALPLFMDFVGCDMLVMHNAKFDGSFLQYEMKEYNIDKELHCFCTLLASRKYIKSANYKLSTLKNTQNLRTIGTMHRAISDAFVTAQLYLKLIKNWGIDSSQTLTNGVEKLLGSMEPDDIFILDPKILNSSN